MINDGTACQIKDVDIFSELSDKSITNLKSLFTTKKYKRKALITKPGERGKVYVIKNGRIELYDQSPSGKKVIFSILKKGMVFGDFGFDYPPAVYACSIEDAEICEINTRSFLAVVQKEPKLLLKLFQYFFNRLQILQKKVASLATDDVLNRLIKLLLSHSKPINKSGSDELISDRFTHQQLSQMLGVSRQTTSTIISNLQKKGLLQRKKKSFIIKSKISKLLIY